MEKLNLGGPFMKQEKMMVKEWGLEFDNIGLYEADEIEVIAKNNEQEFYKKFIEETWSYYVAILWHPCASEKLKKEIINATKKLVKGGQNE